MSGATLMNNFISIFQIMCMGLGMGTSVLTSRFFGMHDRNSMKKAANLMMRTQLVIASPFAVVRQSCLPGSRGFIQQTAR